MSQNDFNLANQGFPSMRSDINSALQALASNSSGTTAPATPYANQFWYETDTNILYIRDEANTAWLELMVIDGTTGSPSFNSGNVGIGTSSPSERLQVATADGLSVSNALLRLGNTSASNALLLGYSGVGDVTDGAPAIYSTSVNGSTGIAGHIAYKARSDSARDHIFYTGTTPTERFRINSAGNVGIGTTAPLSPLQVNGTNGEVLRISTTGDAGTQQVFGLGFATATANTNPAAAIYAQELDASDARAGLNFFTRGSNSDTAPTQRMFISDQGVVSIFDLAGAGSRTVTAGSGGGLSAASDSRLKEEVVEASIPSLAEIMLLKPRAYKWLDDIEKRGEDASVEIGFFADEVKDIIPSAAPLGNDGYYGFYDRAVIAALTKGMQEQQAMIASLEARIATLEN
jgi:hypothetical protein